LREKAQEWINANSGRTRTDLLLENLRNSAEPGAVLAAAGELTRNKETAALPLIFLRIQNLQKAEDQASLAECCFRLAPERSVEEARKWLNKGGEMRFWAAMILFSNGDWSKREGWAELKEALANDDKELTAYKRAFDALLKSGRPEALEVAVGVLKRFNKDTSVWDIKPFVHRLILAGRKEALDYMLAALEDKTTAGTTSSVIDGKRVTIELTRADEFAEDLSCLRKDEHMYSYTTSEAERIAERQNIGHPKLFMVGKASAVEPWPQPTVNNFVAARGEPIRMANGVPVRYRFIGFPAPAGQVCDPTVVATTCGLSTGPSGGAWPSNDYSRGRC